MDVKVISNWLPTGKQLAEMLSPRPSSRQSIITEVSDTSIGRGFTVGDDPLAVIQVGRVLVRPHGRPRKGSYAYIRKDGKLSTYARERPDWKQRVKAGVFATDGDENGKAVLLADVPRATQSP